MTTDTTAPSYWLNWRFLLCAIWILSSMVFAAFLIWRYEGCKKSRNRGRESQKETAKSLYKNEVWGTCWKAIHPLWLLAYRIIAFGALLSLLLADAIIHSAGIFYFYTQWTFTLVTIYFGVGSSISIHGCVRYFRDVDGERDDNVGSDSECGSYVAPSLGNEADWPSTTRRLNHHREPLVRRTADAWEYAFQILFQICAGAVTLTDCVFWLIIYPFLTGKDYRLHFLVVCMHSINAVFLLGETFLNCLRFPFFRIAYFVLWTCIFVIFQWIIHACVSMWWPYSFLDLSSPYAPIWYFGVGLLHLPCFAIFTLIFRIKQFCLSR
ncbi:hypothetical protein Adt_15794 [Abeliophyllum distichum]|uniref:Transmembrane protein n=1 Tax=Abeliophyllum distichum TaxID=126358 RepID=A0ABD1U3I7_9LAMI